MTWIGLAREIYVRLPVGQRVRLRMVDLAYSIGGPAFRRTAHYQAWRRKRAAAKAAAPRLMAPDPRPFSEQLAALAFAEVAQPDVSIVVPSFGKLGVTLHCLASLHRHGAKCSFEVLVAEDASADGDVDQLRRIPGLRYVRNEKNLGFVGNCNAAARRARGEYLAFLNNDTEVCAGWLDALLDVFRDFPAAGLVGARILLPDGRLQEAGGIVFRDGGAYQYGRFDDPQASCYNFVRETDYCSAAAILMPRALFRSLGGFSEEFAPAYYEDTDLAFRVRAAGHRVYVQPAAVVLHDEGTTHGNDVEQGLKSGQRRNGIVFRLKWREVLEREHYAYDGHTMLAAQRLRGRRVALVIDQYIPRPDSDAGSRSVDLLMDGLTSLGWTVKFWPHNLWVDPQYAARLQARGIEVFYGEARYADRMESVLRELDPCLGAVVLNRPRIAYEHLATIRRATRARVVFYGIDIHHQRLRQQNEVRPGAVPESEIEGMRWLEEFLWTNADATYYPSHDEVRTVRARAPAARALVLPLYSYHAAHDAPPRPLRAAGKLLFVGGFSHESNVDAALWFARDILPLVLQQVPRARLVIVGSNPPREVLDLAGAAIEVLGWVPEDQLRAHYDSAMVSVVPVRWGGGVKGKIVESLQYGVPAVATSVGAQGLIDVGAALRIVDDARAFCGHVVQLLTSEVAWQSQSSAMQAYASRHFSAAALRQAIEDGFGKLALPQRLPPRVPLADRQLAQDEEEQEQDARMLREGA
jgi:GT2 family glycosyltransferase